MATSRSWQPEVAWLTGSALTGLLAGYLALLSGRTARVEQLVAKRTAELHTISNAALDAVVMMNPEGNVAEWNPAAENMFGYRREEVLGRQVHETIAPQKYRERMEKGLRGFFEHGRGSAVGRVLELDALHKDGRQFPIEISVSAIHSDGQWWAVAIIRDITARKRAEEALQTERRLLKKMLALQERERKLTAYEIHDGLAQQLTGALFNFQAFGRLRESDPEQAQAAFDQAVRLLSESMDESRRLISGLRPPILDESGIVTAIDYLVCECRQLGGPEIEFVNQVGFDRLEPPLEIAVFRIVQESLANAARHSRSRNLRVEIVQRDDRLHVVVQDWGIGFDPATVEEHRFGLQGIRERARLLDGRATVESAPGEGTRITVELPLPAETPRREGHEVG